jgi:hypothetical protein
VHLLRASNNLIGDDYHHYWAAVIRVSHDFATEEGVPLSARDPKWIMRKPA